MGPDDSTIFMVIGGVIGFAVILTLLIRSIFTIHTKEAGIVERFGKFHRIASEGLNFKNPFIDSVVYVEDLSMQLMDVEVQSKTSDDATVTIPVRVQYYVRPEKVKEAYYELDDPAKQIAAHIRNVILSYVPGITLDQAYKQEQDIAIKIKDALSGVMTKFGYAIENALVTQIVPAKEVVAAMNAINTQRREKVAVEAKAEADKLVKVKAAEAEAEAKRLEGQGIANQRKAIIEGLQKSVEDFKTATGVNVEEVMALVLMTQYFDMMKEVGKNSNTILMPSSPQGMVDLAEQMRNAMMVGNLAVPKEIKKAA